MPNNGNWLEKRKLKWRFSQPLVGIVNSILILVLFLIFWWIFMDPTGLFGLYTPLFGVTFVAGIITVTIWHVQAFDFWPFSHKTLSDQHPILKGIFLTVFVLAVVALIYIIFTYVIGALSIPYFSRAALVNLGIDGVIAREHAALAMTSFLVISLIFILVLKNAFNNYPWNELKQPAQGFSVSVIAGLLGIIAFAILIHPHFGVLYLPWQEYLAAFPWWEQFTKTIHGNYSLGLIISYLTIIFLSGTIWEGKPWDRVKSQPQRGLFTLVGTLVITFIFFSFFIFINELRWGLPIEGAFRTESINWRYLHAGEMTFFMVLPAAIIYFYFDNWPKKFVTELNWIIRTAITVIGGVIVYALYYFVGPTVLNVVAGFADPDQFPLAAVMLFVALILIHSWYFDYWPTGKIIKEKRQIESE